MYKKEIIPKIIPNTKYKSNIEIPLLLNLFDFQTPTGNKVLQREYFNYINKIFIKKRNIKCNIEFDSYGNIYITKGNTEYYPCVISHIDTVHSFDKDFKTYHCDDFIIGLSNGEQCGMGADPKAGLYILLQMLEHFENIKCVLFQNEEQGCKGSREANMDFFKDCSYVLQYDRRSFTTDVIEHTNGVQVLSDEFKSLLQPLMNNYNYSFNYGTCTDVGQLRNNGLEINSTNLSNGSFNEHFENEVCSVSHLLNALNFGFEILKTIENKQYVFKKEVYKSKSYSRIKKWEYEEYYDKTGNVKDEVGMNEGFSKEIDADELAWVKEDTCPECCMQDTLTKLDDNEVYCNYCGINYFIPDELQSKKSKKQHSFSETWIN